MMDPCSGRYDYCDSGYRRPMRPIDLLLNLLALLFFFGTLASVAKIAGGR